MKLTVDRGCFRCYISWAVGNNCFLERDNLKWFLKEKKKLKKCLTTWNKHVKVIKSLEQSRQSQIGRTVRKSGRVRKTLKKTWKKFLTKKKRCDKVNKLSTNSESVEKKIWKNLKKFLTNQKQHDKINKLTQDRQPW